MAKEISGFIKLQIKGGQANPAPPVGPALGQRGVNIMEFCKAFNDKTKSMAGKPVPVEITVYKDKKFDFKIKSPPESFYIKEAVKLKGGSKAPGRNILASITKKQAEEIAKQKMSDLNALDLDQAVKIISGQMDQQACIGLSKEMRDKGYGLLCVSKAIGPLECETQDEDEVYNAQFGKYFKGLDTQAGNPFDI